MAINRINNGDSGSIVRQIINSIIDLVNGFGIAISDLATKVTGIENAIGNSIFTQEDRNKLDNAVTTTVLTSELQKKVTAVPGSRLITESEGTKLASAVTSQELSDGLGTKVTAVPNQRLITEEEAIKLASAVTSQELSDGLGTKVTAVPNHRLITEQEAIKLASAVASGDLEPYSLKDTGVLEEITEVPIEEDKYIKFFDEAAGVEKKISMPNFIIGVSNPVYPTARALVGDKNGMNEIFYSEYNYIAGSEKLNINGSVYYPNSGFYKEGNNIILSGAPIPEAGDFMFLEAVYLD